MSSETNATHRNAMKGGAISAASEPDSRDEAAVGQVLMQMARGFATRDADMAAAVYTVDAEWLNAFGDRVVGREQIHAKLVDLFGTEEFDAGEIVGQPSGSVRILSQDAAVGWTYQEIAGQHIEDTGEVIPLRKNHSLAVFTSTGGEWLIAAHIFMDENVVE